MIKIRKRIILCITVILITLLFCGCLDENKAPKADFTTSIFDTGFSDIRGVKFQDVSSDPDGEIVKWNWDFGDGSTSNVQNPWHNYTSGGYYEYVGEFHNESFFKGPLYNVTLTVTDDKNLKTSVTKTVFPQQYPTVVPLNLSANFTYNPTESITTQTLITFNASSSETHSRNVTYYWDFGDGTNVTEISITTTHRYTTVGTYYVNLTITDEIGLTDYKIKDITVV